VLKMTDLDLAEQRVLIREDLNVPTKNGEVVSDTRIRAALPTIKAALAANAHVIVMSHLGRPIEGVEASRQQEYSLRPVAAHLEKLLEVPVKFKTKWIKDPPETSPGQVTLLENVRFIQGEKSNDAELAKTMARLCDVFVMDAFGTAHRAHASTHGVAQYAPIACAGPLLVRELEALERALAEPASPVVAIVGGAKVSTKLSVLEKLSEKVDQLIVGGGIANTFLAAAGFPVGKSLCEFEMLDLAKQLMANTDIPLPTDVVVASEINDRAAATCKLVGEVAEDDIILDVGPNTYKKLAKLLTKARTIIWNGPLGVFEIDQFSAGTEAIARAIAESDAFSLAGGGDTLAAIEKYGIFKDVSYISTGGGAFLEYIEGKELPAVSILKQRALDMTTVE